MSSRLLVLSAHVPLGTYPSLLPYRLSVDGVTLGLGLQHTSLGEVERDGSVQNSAHLNCFKLVANLQRIYMCSGSQIVGL